MASPTETLQTLMQTANLKSYRALAQQADVSRWQIQQLRSGNIEKMRVDALEKIGKALDISLTELLERFLPQSVAAQSNTKLKKTQNHLSQQSPTPPHNELAVQTDALQTLETWLTQWPTISKRAQANPELSATKLLPFIRPVEELMSEWHVEPIATIDEQIPYDPTHHQLTKGNAKPGELVQVTHTGFTHNGKLLHRAKVKPI
mgnify:CR=1 FL=1